MNWANFIPQFTVTISARILTEGQLCAYDKDVDTCQGDSGGPMIVHREELGRINTH